MKQTDSDGNKRTHHDFGAMVANIIPAKIVNQNENDIGQLTLPNHCCNHPNKNGKINATEHFVDQFLPKRETETNVS